MAIYSFLAKSILRSGFWVVQIKDCSMLGEEPLLLLFDEVCLGNLLLLLSLLLLLF